MTFIVRQISKTADGREIVRTATHEGDSLTIGRDSANAVHLPDLAVAMEHARLTRAAGSRVVVEALGTQGFEADSRTETRVVLPSLSTPVILRSSIT